MKKFSLTILLTFAVGSVSAQEVFDPSLFQVGVYGDRDRTITCLAEPAGATVEQAVWAWVPDELGLAYITLRFGFPDNLDMSNHPVFHPNVVDVIITDYGAGTIEWNLIFEDCPSGWVLVFTQEIILLNDQPARIDLLGDNSMIRDCTFVLNDLVVLAELTVNDPDCPTVSTATSTWCGLKCLYRY